MDLLLIGYLYLYLYLYGSYIPILRALRWIHVLDPPRALCGEGLDRGQLLWLWKSGRPTRAALALQRLARAWERNNVSNRSCNYVSICMCMYVYTYIYMCVRERTFLMCVYVYRHVLSGVIDLKHAPPL